MAGQPSPNMKAFKSRRLPAKGMLNDIWETPQVLKGMLKQHLEEPSAFEPPPRAAATRRGSRVRFPGLERPLPASHGLAGRSPLEVMAACASATEAVNNKFIIIGCGTSYHAAVLAEYLIEYIARIPVEVQYASEYRYRKPLVRSGDVLIVISNSGETAESVESLRLVQGLPGAQGVLTMGVVNEVDSTIARDADCMIAALAGEERGTSSTKVFSSTVMALLLLAVALGEAAGTLPESEAAVLLEKVEVLPEVIQKVIERESRPLKQDENGKQHDLYVGECQLWDISCQNVLANNFIFLGRGFNFPIALEGAMKCKEIAYIHAEGYPAAEMKHGPIALIDQFMPVVVIAPRADPTYEKIKANIEEVNARSGATIAITEDGNTELEALCEYVIQVPETHEYLMPLVAVIPLQLLAYMMGVLRGNEVDHPRGLLKSVSASPAIARGGSLEG